MMTSLVLAATLMTTLGQQGTLPGSGPTLVQCKVVGPYFLVDVKVNGKPARFLVDSGAGMTVMTPEAADRIGIKGGLPIKANGAGAKQVDARLIKLETMSIGGVEVKSDQAVVLELPEILKCDGLVGYSFLRHFATTFDYAKQTLTFGPSGKHQVRGDEMQVEMKLIGNIPVVPGSVDGIKGWHNIDTGANTALTVHRPFIEENKLEVKYPNRRHTIVGKGVGGFAYGDKAVIGSFELAGYEFKTLQASFAGKDAGILSKNTTIGNVGADVIRKFIMTLDYPAKKAYFRPSPLFGDPFTVDRAGVFADYDKGVFTLVDVIKGSPAEKVGLKNGDVLRSLAGIKVSDVHPLEFGRPLKGAPGKKVEVEYTRGGKSEKTTVTLADF